MGKAVEPTSPPPLPLGSWVPDIVVGIDFGMTCTGVAWSRGPVWAEPKAFQHWPGKMISELANKVPTILQYASDSPHVQRWGFMCDPDGEDAGIVDCFKLHLDSAFTEDTRPDRPTTFQARQWYLDYLRCIHDHVAGIFSDVVPGWRDLKVEFIFSVPTTWKNPGMVADIERILPQAGFGRDGLQHRAVIGLTEAEAAAVYASKQQFQRGDVILVCDAGGGTTDVNVLRILSASGEPVALEPLSWVEGRPVGSIAIDTEFHHLAVSRLSLILDRLDEDPRIVADRMMRDGGVFERYKCSFGSTLSNVMPALPLKVPGLVGGLDYPEARIENSNMMFSKEDLQAIFDNQINKMIALTDEQLDRVKKQHPNAHVSWLVLAGGLGSSPYLKERLRSHYTTGPGSLRRAVDYMSVATVEEPQLAVIQGLVSDRIQSIERGVGSFTKRCCRQSYGVICREEYKPQSTRHLGQPVSKDHRDGKTWVDGQIQWFIVQGQSVSLEGVSKPFSVLIAPGKEFEAWKTPIVMSYLPQEQLPTNVRQDGVKRLCEVSSVLKSHAVDMKLKNRHWYNRGRKYWRFRFNVKAVIGAADLKFVLMTKDDQEISSDHNAIEIIWQAGKDGIEGAMNGVNGSGQNGDIAYGARD